MLVALDNSGEAGSSSPDPQLTFWKSLWSLTLRVPNKVKHFAWRACNNALPTMVNLQQRHISTSDLCEQCTTKPEDTLHALWACSKLEEVWRTLSWTLLAAQACPLTFNALLDCFLKVKDNFRKEIFIMTAWTIWNRRNALKFGRPTIPVANIIPRAGSLLQEFVSAQQVVDESPSVAVSSQWQPPEFPYYKVKFDVVVFKASSSARIGVIIRDSSGNAIGALLVPTPLSNSIAVMEALAC